MTSPPTTEQEQEYNSIDRICEEAIKEADKHCQKLKLGAVPFTPEYGLVIIKIRLWALVLKHKTSGKVDS